MKTQNHLTLLKQGACRTPKIGELGRKKAVRLLDQMIRLRKLEETLMREYHPANEMRCPVHFCLGQEAVPGALSLVVKNDDFIFSHHRSHGYFFAKGAPLEGLVAELYGKKEGSSGGRAGSQDISHAGKRFFSGAILAGATSIGIGAALGSRMQKKADVVFCGFGEACTEEGAFWEGLNLAVAKKLPVVFLCENNRYSTFSDWHARNSGAPLLDKIKSFGIKASQEFGNDAAKAYAAIQAGARWARAGRGPIFLEFLTYRWCAHVGPEDDSVNRYRENKEMAFWKKNCPIKLLAEAMRKQGWADAQLVLSLEKKAEKEMDGYLLFAKKAPFPQVTNWREMNESPERTHPEIPDEKSLRSGFDAKQADAFLTSY